MSFDNNTHPTVFVTFIFFCSSLHNEFNVLTNYVWSLVQCINNREANLQVTTSLNRRNINFRCLVVIYWENKIPRMNINPICFYFLILQTFSSDAKYKGNVAVSTLWGRRGFHENMHDKKPTLQWCHNECDCISNHQPHDCLLNRLFRRRSRITSKLRVTGLWARNSPVAGEFPTQRSSNKENASIWWRHHEIWRTVSSDLIISCDAYRHSRLRKKSRNTFTYIICIKLIYFTQHMCWW